MAAAERDEAAQAAGEPGAPPGRAVVFDTGVVLQATLNPGGPARRALELLDAGQIQVYTSPRLRSEYEDVLRRPAIRARFPRLTDLRMEETLLRFDERAILIPNPPQRVTFPRDPNDEPVLNLAIHVAAGYIVARDNDLLHLAQNRDFLRLFPAIRILDPVEFLHEVALVPPLQPASAREQEPTPAQPPMPEPRNSGRTAEREP